MFFWNLMHSFNQIKNEGLKNLITNIQNMGFEYVSLGLRKPWKNSVLCFFTDKRWEEHYINNGLYENDPLVIASDVIDSPLLWSATSIDTKERAAIMKTRNEMINVRDGITFYLKGKNYSHILAMASAKDRITILDNFIHNFHSIQKILTYAEEIVKTCPEK